VTFKHAEETFSIILFEAWMNAEPTIERDKMDHIVCSQVLTW